MSKQLEFLFDEEKIVEADNENSLYNYCIRNDKTILLDEWDNEKNKFSPKEIDFDSTKKVYWKCSIDGFSYLLSPNARTGHYESGCPMCANKVVVRGVNDLETLYPDIAKRWDNEKNGDKKPYMYSPRSDEKFCFICDKGHSFEASIKQLVLGKAMCNKCAKRKIVKVIIDIFTLYPKIKKEWDKEKNKDIDPYKLTKGSRKKVWLICSNGHSYQTTLVNRINNNRTCPYCLNLKPIEGKTDLKTLRKDLIKEYSDKNSIDMSNLMLDSKKIVLWKCSKCGKEYKMSVTSKVKGKKCPICKK